MSDTVVADLSKYIVTDFIDPAAVGPTVATGINNHGEITGYYSPEAAEPIAAGFVAQVTNDGSGGISVGSYGTVVDPAGPSTEGYGVDDFGDVVGVFSEGGVSKSFVDTGGNFVTVFDTLDLTTDIEGTNDAGDVVGNAEDTGGTVGAYTVISGAISQFQVPGDGTTQFSFAQGINNADSFVGYYYDDKGNHGYIDQGGSITPLNEPDGDAGETFAYGINNNGAVSGSFEMPGGVWEPFVYFDGTYTEYPIAVGAFSHVGINDAGQLVAHSGDSEDGVLITPDGVACYCAGTRILTAQGEVAVEDLAIGDLVATLSGGLRPVRWIGRRGYARHLVQGRRDLLPIVIRAGALGENVPRRDLRVSPEHALFIDGALVAADLLVNGASIVQCEAPATLAYFHVELARHDVILAEGAAAESFAACDNRGVFANAADYVPRRGGDDSPQWAFCAPHMSDGAALEAVRERINARAGLTAPPRLGALIGNLDVVNARRIAGWARDEANPEVPVRLEILDGAEVIACITAQRRRVDLERAGFGDGRHGFDLPHRLDPGAPHAIRVRRAADGLELFPIATTSKDAVMVPGEYGVARSNSRSNHDGENR